LYDLDLRGVNLATLSACNTERGKLIRGEGCKLQPSVALFRLALALTTLLGVAIITSEFRSSSLLCARKGQSKAERCVRQAQFLRSKTELETRPLGRFVLTGDDSMSASFVSWVS